MSSLEKVFQIIEAIGRMGIASISDISSTTGYPPSTIHRIVSAMTGIGYLMQNPSTRAYSLSLKFLKLGAETQENFSLSGIARPYLVKLKEKTGENANLAVLDDKEAVYIEHIPGEHNLRIFTKLGARVPLYATGVGKIFMSQWSAEEVDQYLEAISLVPYTRKTIVRYDKIMKELVVIKRKGFAIDNEERNQGVRCVAALVYYYNRNNAAAISISGASLRIPNSRFLELGRLVTKYAVEIAQLAGWA